ncbi:hypothetical protein HF086_007522 [Spodoptera exigua]|uniref:PWI domain-containing protein n=1 Tax=Spodoptera exigua TaxID=7107 RepID=A0A922M2D6_SPOEX|nr:hypothetical protein HF086_007522 [Spodoptera exigua]
MSLNIFVNDCLPFAYCRVFTENNVIVLAAVIVWCLKRIESEDDFGVLTPLGTSTEQDTRFSDKEKKLMKQMKFGDCLTQQLDVLKPWITQKITEILKMEDDVVIDYVNNQLEEKHQTQWSSLVCDFKINGQCIEDKFVKAVKRFFDLTRGVKTEERSRAASSSGGAEYAEHRSSPRATLRLLAVGASLSLSRFQH